jgi:hypothetical protein
MLKRLLLVAALGMMALFWAGTPALATGPVTCPPGQTPDPKTGVCVIVVVTPPGPADSRPGGSSRTNDPGPAVAQKCVKPDGVEIPCRDGTSWWSNALYCYIALADPQPPQSDPIWAGHMDGAIYTCYSPMIVAGNPMYSLWAVTPPAGPAAPPDPRVLAQQAIALMRLRAINIGIVPEPRAGSVGIIGMPTWMWAQNPSQNMWGPIAKSASAGGYTVTATAKVDRVAWAMGDGSTVACTGPGTAYQDSFGKKSSPSCGHTYTRQGTYTVRATSSWTVQWTGVGQSGTIPLTFTQTTNITMGEAQVLTQ